MTLFERLEFHLRRLAPARRVNPDELPDEGAAPEFTGIEAWLNSGPLTLAQLRGKVVLVDFWTYSCINCIRTLPHVQAWHDRYKDLGLVVIGVHTPEFPFERDQRNVRAQVAKRGITYPVALDAAYATWRAYRNRYWPAHYFIDAKGRIRHRHVGEGGYAGSEAVIRALLREAGHAEGSLPRSGTATEAATEDARELTPETYFGYERMQYLGSPEHMRMDATQRYSAVPDPAMGIFYLDGDWEITADHAIPKSYGARIIYRVRAAKVYLVMDTDRTDAKIHVLEDGKELADAVRGEDLGMENGRAVTDVQDARLFTLIDSDDVRERLIEVRFLEPGARVYAMTFG